MVLPASLTELFYKKLSFYSCTVSNFEQYTLARFMESGSFEKHINRLRNYYQNKRDAILEIFKTAPLDQYITIKEEEMCIRDRCIRDHSADVHVWIRSL